VCSLAKLVIIVHDAGTQVPLPYTQVDADGSVLTTGLDGVCSFDVTLGKAVVVKVRHSYYRPWSSTVQVNTERFEVSCDLEKAILG